MLCIQLTIYFVQAARDYRGEVTQTSSTRAKLPTEVVSNAEQKVSGPHIHMCALFII
jgi:hypothetical protein